MNEIAKIRQAVEKAMVAYLWLHLPVVVAVGLLVGGEVVMPAVGALVLAGAATLSWQAAPGSAGTRYTSSVALMGVVAILVYQFAGHPWQIDLHMYFFAAIAIVTAFCDWRTLVAAAAAVAVHHLVLNFAYPAAVFPGGGSFARVVLHAVVVVIQTAVLSWVAWRLIEAFGASETALAKARAAEDEARQISADRDRMTQENESRRRAEMHGLADSFQGEIGRFVETLSRSAGATRAAAQELDSMVDGVSQKAAAAAESSQEVTSNVETVAAAAEELSASVREVNRFIEESSKVARDAVGEVERTNATVESMATAADRIGDVVNLIQDIASQTNLLALNATIEAARAGDAGKGFAVVANEVKSLANQTAKATEEISGQIAAIQHVTSGAVAAIRDIGALIGRIEQAVSTISASAASQGTAIDEIARSAQRAAQVTDTVSRNIASVSDFAGNLEGMSAQRVADAASLADQAQGVSSHVEKFVAQLRVR